MCNLKHKMMNKINLKSVVIAAIFSVAFVSFSNAQSQKPNKQKKPPTFSELLKEMDKNEDGKLAKSEIKGPLKKGFDEVDTDKNGFISESEFKKAPKRQRKERPDNK